MPPVEGVDISTPAGILQALGYKELHFTSDGELSSYTDYGCYPIMYLTEEGDTYCPACALLELEEDLARAAEGYPPELQGMQGVVNYESLYYCDRCGLQLESADLTEEELYRMEQEQE